MAILDVKGLSCPLPVLRTHKLLKSMIVGEELTVLATDPAAPQDFVTFCNTTGIELIDSRDEDGVFVIVVRKTS